MIDTDAQSHCVARLIFCLEGDLSSLLLWLAVFVAHAYAMKYNQQDHVSTLETCDWMLQLSSSSQVVGRESDSNGRVT